jgi:hypothetical protein
MVVAFGVASDGVFVTPASSETVRTGVCNGVRGPSLSTESEELEGDKTGVDNLEET